MVADAPSLSSTIVANTSAPKELSETRIRYPFSVSVTDVDGLTSCHLGPMHLATETAFLSVFPTNKGFFSCKPETEHPAEATSAKTNGMRNRVSLTAIIC